jgi:hypothetical protein
MIKKAKPSIIACLIAFILILNTLNISTNFGEERAKIDKNQNQTVICDVIYKNPGAIGVVINASEFSGENDTERLQRALNAVPPEGGTVIILGIWEACGLKAKSNTVILGINGVIHHPQNRTNPFITFENETNFAILNMTFNGDGVDMTQGILIVDCKNFTIQNNNFLNIKRNALKICTSVDGQSKNFTIKCNTFINCNDAPILVFGIPSKRNIYNFTISNNLIFNGTLNGKIGIAFSTNGSIVNNTIVNCGHGIATRCISNLTIVGNIIRNCEDYGIYIGTQIGDDGSENIQIGGNIVENCSIGIARYYGAYIVKYVQIENNLFVNNRIYDVVADFPAIYINNTLTSKEKLVILDLQAFFFKTKTITNEVIMPGDINSDLKIDIIDIAIIASLFGCRKGFTCWIDDADVIKDEIIDIKDVSYVSRFFGRQETEIFE